MSLQLPLAVRLKTTRTDVHVEAQVRDLSWRTAIPGGFASATFSIDRPLSTAPDDLLLFGNVYIYDTRHGGTVWEGRLEDPGRGANDQGETWQITAVGPSAHAGDRKFAIIYVDESLDRWTRSQYSTKDAHTEVDEIDSNTPALMVYAVEGQPVALTWAGDWIYRFLTFTGQKIGRVRCDHIEGGASSNYQSGIYTRNGNATGAFVALDNWATTQQTMAASYGTAGFVDGMNNVSIAAIRNVSPIAAPPGANDLAWSKFYNVSVQAARKNADGTDITSAYLVNNVDPVEVYADLLGRYLNQYDGPNANLQSSGFDLDQLAYPDGVTAAQIFDDLALFEPTFYWAAWETNPLTGKWRFEYVPWPTTVRYEATTVDGFSSPGSAAELYNAVTVRWLDPKGKMRTTRRTQTVPELSAIGLTREELIDLSDEMGSSVNATSVGDNFLAEHKYPPNAGLLTVTRPILDTLTGRMVMPWEILPGHLIRVGGVVPRIDSLNPSSRDGVTVFKIVSMEFSSETASATLELDTFSRSVARSLATLKTRRLRKR